MSDVVRISVGMQVSYIANSTQENEIEVPRAEWDALKTEEAREEYLARMAQEEIDNYVSAWATVIDEGD